MKKVNLRETASFRYLCRSFWKAKGVNRLPRGQLAHVLENVEGLSIVLGRPSKRVWLYEGEY
jgi:hypothetical protein